MNRSRVLKVKKQALIVKVHCFLKQTYPELFEKPFRPFAVGIDKEILEAHPSISPKILEEHLKNIVNHPLYLVNFLESHTVYRTSLDGTLTEEITELDANYARSNLIALMDHMEQKYRHRLGDKIVDEIVYKMGKM